MKCNHCQTAELISSPINESDLEFLGIPVLVHGAKKYHCPECSKTEFYIPDMAGLVASAAISLVLSSSKLNSAEIKFLRKSLEINAKDLAEKLGVAPETISRWENNKQAISESQDRLLRLQVVSKLGSKSRGVTACWEDILALKISPIRNEEGTAVSYLPLDEEQINLGLGCEQNGAYKRA